MRTPAETAAREAALDSAIRSIHADTMAEFWKRQQREAELRAGKGGVA